MDHGSEPGGKSDRGRAQNKKLTEETGGLDGGCGKEENEEIANKLKGRKSWEKGDWRKRRRRAWKSWARTL